MVSANRLELWLVLGVAFGCGDEPAARRPDEDASMPVSDAAGRDADIDPPGAGGAGVLLPPPNAGLDYQLGGAYTPAESVQIVSRDRQAAPAPGLYNICYVNGFQAQPDENDFWLDEHADLVLRDGAGKPIIDPDWDEMLLDVSSADKRERLAEIVGGWIARCAEDGFDAVEIDNLDTYSRSGGRIAEDDAVAFLALLATRAHAHGLAIGQKNSAELVSRRAQMGTDFAVVEECNRYDECSDFTAGYGDHVLVIEYRRADFERGCQAFSSLSIVLRDVALRPRGASGYVFDGC